jgi:Fe-Mn family superoxide dismutase
MIKGAYYAKNFNLSGLNGISDRTLEAHFKLYEGYVSGINSIDVPPFGVL